MADGERVPVRLVQENGNTISLDATSIDMVVERQQSAFGIPLADAKKMAIDLNQAVVGFEIQGVFTDDEGQEVSSQAKAVVDFNHTQTLYDEDAGKPIFLRMPVVNKKLGRLVINVKNLLTLFKLYLHQYTHPCTC